MILLMPELSSECTLSSFWMSYQLIWIRICMQHVLVRTLLYVCGDYVGTVLNRPSSFVARIESAVSRQYRNMLLLLLWIQRKWQFLLSVGRLIHTYIRVWDQKEESYSISVCCCCFDPIRSELNWSELQCTTLHFLIFFDARREIIKPIKWPMIHFYWPSLSNAFSLNNTTGYNYPTY